MNEKGIKMLIEDRKNLHKIIEAQLKEIKELKTK